MKYIVPLSGKDSIACAVLLRKLHPERQFIYPGTPVVDREPDELLPWLHEAARRCGGEYIRVNAVGFDECLRKWGGFLPSPKMRWCTRELKIEPMERWLAESAWAKLDGNHDAWTAHNENGRAVLRKASLWRKKPWQWIASLKTGGQYHGWCSSRSDAANEVVKRLGPICTIYLGLRADEDRDGNTGEVKGITYEYPLVDHGVDEDGALRLVAELFKVPVPHHLTGRQLWNHLIDHGALPEFYRWLTHANCYGCIFWRIDQWRELYFRDPDRYWCFAAQEDVGSHFTYHQDWTLAQLAERFNIEAAGFKVGARRHGGAQLRLADEPLLDLDPWDRPCAACRIGG